jgi:hypothetical protein
LAPGVVRLIPLEEHDVTSKAVASKEINKKQIFKMPPPRDMVNVLILSYLINLSKKYKTFLAL